MKLVFVGTFAIAIGCLVAQAPSVAQTRGQTAAQTPALKNAIGMEFVKIPTGEFMMGCSAGDSNCKNDEKPQHQVRITKAFEMGRYEVTQAQWKAVMNANESAIVGDSNPVENVTRAEALDFASRLTMRNDGYRYRLPTEAEWEYAARAGTTGVTYGPLEDIAWFGKNSNDESHPVGGKKPNAWGLYDMIGNVREWTADTYSANYYATSPADDPPGAPPNTGLAPPGRGTPGVALPVIRGGGWPNPEDSLRVSDRYHYFGPTLRVSDVGFRLVREAVAR
jgi:formylglycine-generating enzyme required for sulfatase activity